MRISAQRCTFILYLAILFLLPSCAKKKVIQVGEFESYQDPVYGFGISHPKEWVVDPESGKRVRIYSSRDAYERFVDPTGTKPAGVRIEVGVDTTKGVTLESYVEAVKERYAEISSIGQEERTTLDGNPAVKIPYSTQVDRKNVIRGYRIAALKDNAITYVDVEGFNELMDDYKAVFDTALTTVRFARVLMAMAKEDISKPADTFDTYKGKFFDIAYPTNFDFKFPQKPNTDIIMEMKGYRQDCTVRIEVSDAKNLTVEKVVAQNEMNLQKVGYRIRKRATTSIDGHPAALIDLTYAKGEVDSRAYFAVKENKMYYIFLTWFRPQTNVYVPVFEKMVASLKLKT